MDKQEKRKYRVAYLDQSFVFSGAESSLAALIAHIDTQRFIPSLWFVFPRDHQERFSIPGIEKHYLEPNNKWWMGSDYWKNPLRGTDFLKRFILGLKLATRLRARRIDILHINLAKPESFWWAFWSNLFGIQVVFHCRSDPMAWVPNKLVQRHSAAIIAVSNFVRDKVLKKNPKAPVTTIYNPILFTQRSYNTVVKAKSLLELGFGPETVLLSSVGLLSPHKGHEMAIRVFRNIIQKLPNAKLYIAGGGSAHELDNLKSAADELFREGKVIFSEGQVDNINTIYRASSLVFSLTTRGEAFGRVPFEAMAVGAPVLAPRLGGAAEIIEDDRTGFLVNPIDEAEITEKTFQILNNQEWARNITENGKQYFAVLLSPAKSAQAVMDVYESILDGEK
jgi:phosphatidylinositol alpha-1,6-mannosyltransferase